MFKCYMPKFRSLVCLLALLLLVEGCTMAPTYIRPDAPIPNTYAMDTLGSDSEKFPGWKEFFPDANMQRVIELALLNNRDLRIAMLNIERTRAQYRIQRADILPTIEATGQAVNQRVGDDFATMPGVNNVQRQYTASLGFSAFELDVFGRIRSLTEQALQTYYSAEEESRAAQLALVAETAAMYLQLVADRELYDLTEATAQTREKNLELITNKFNVGVASDLDVSQAETLLEQARVNLAEAATRIGQDTNYLTLLMGTGLPDDLPEARKLSDVAQLADIPAGLPSELLERRPDIRAAEHTLMGANANIGAARAAFFPTIGLTGDIGTMSAEFSELFHSGTRAWTFMPFVSLPIFDTGRNIARLEVSEADRDIAVARYEKAIQTAFREVADALVQRANIGDQLAAQAALVNATERSYNHASTRYDAGVSDYLAVLDAQRSLYTAQSGMIATRLLREANALTLYKALGGGWY